MSKKKRKNSGGTAAEQAARASAAAYLARQRWAGKTPEERRAATEAARAARPTGDALADANRAAARARWAAIRDSHVSSE